MKNTVLVLILMFIINSCEMNNQDFYLPGKIAYEQINENKYFIFDNGKASMLNLLKTEKLSYGELKWLNNNDLFICIEYLCESNMTTKSNIVLINSKGKKIKNIFNSKQGEYVGDVYPSINDKKILFISWKSNKNSNPLNFPITINILDLERDTVLLKIENFSSQINFEIEETPWSPDENRFVYCITTDKKFEIRGVNDTDIVKDHGIYIYDLEKNEYQRIIEKGYNAIWSPRGDFIAYINDNKIWLYNLFTKKTELFYKPENLQEVNTIHWSPDGEYIYVFCPKYSNDIILSYDEKFIRIKDKIEIDFKKPNICFNQFTWKK